MPLTKCPDCGRDVSTLATSCPNCGRPLKPAKPRVILPIWDKYCPYCGDVMALADIYGPCSWKTVDGEKIPLYRCIYCEEAVNPVHPKHDAVYYMDVAQEKYGTERKYEEALLDEIRQNPLFDENKYNRTAQKKEDFDRQRRRNESSSNAPSCPTCGSSNIEKISTTSKVVGATMFGLFSKTARSQFRCKSCGYKW